MFVVTLIRLPWWLLQTVVCLTLSPLSSDERWRHVHARYFSALGTSTEKAFAKAKAFVKKYEAKAIIIDSMGLAMAGDMDRAKDVIAFHRQFTDPLRALGTTPFVVDHEGKLQAGENRKEKGPTGSAFNSWTTRTVLQFIKVSGSIRSSVLFFPRIAQEPDSAILRRLWTGEIINAGGRSVSCACCTGRLPPAATASPSAIPRHQMSPSSTSTAASSS